MKPVPLSRHTSFRIGGDATEYAAPRSLDEFVQTLVVLAPRSPFILGGGSNTLFADEPCSRPVISTARLRTLEFHGRRVRAECGVRLGTLIGASLAHGLAGLEGFVGIPATVGGAVVMNAGGAAGFGFGALVKEVGLVDLESGELVCLRGDEIPWSYRSWQLRGFGVLWAELELEDGPARELRERSREFFHKKRDTQPLDLPSAGCIFKNPPGAAAAQLIDRSGLKGLRFGDAEISTRHANFIVNRGGARAADVRRLIREVQDRVESAFHVRLEPEVVLVDGS